MLPSNEMIRDFERSFESYLQDRLSGPSSLHEAMRYSLLSGGKRIRPSLALESAHLASLSNKTALKFAFAIEIAHSFSLVHDDLPCMDNDDFRRGVPTTHKKFDEATALLAGDALLNLAHETFLSCFSDVSSEAFVRALQFFTQAVGGMILGQAEENRIDPNNLNELLRIQSLKTGALFRASLLCPLLLSGKTNADSFFLECEQFADSFGFAFQIADDLEDSAQDQKQNSKNILTHLGRKAAIELAVERLNSCKISSKFSATPFLLSKLK